MIKSINPYTQNTIQEVAEDNSESIVFKAQRARSAFVEWRQTSLTQRMEIIARVRNLIQDEEPKMALQLSQELGQPIIQARNEIKQTQSYIDYFLQNIESTLKAELILSRKEGHEKITWEPLGVISYISTWNFPLNVAMHIIIPAVLTGNTVLFKPSQWSMLMGVSLDRIFHQAGLPMGVFNLVIGGSEQGEELLRQPLQGVFFTGRESTGQIISSLVSSQFCQLHMELGGKDSVYVRTDAELLSAVNSISRGAFYNSGQSRCSVKRVYLHENIYPTFIDHFVRMVKNFKLGDPTDQDTVIGPLVKQEQGEVLEQQIQDAVRKGARLSLGGKRWNGDARFFEPTVLIDVDHTMEVMLQENFGPLVGIQAVRSDEEAIDLMNDSRFGLTAGVYSQNREAAEKILTQIDTGSVYWNCCDRISPRLPWSGRKSSGVGSSLSQIGLKAFLQPKSWHLRWVESEHSVGN